MFDSLVSGALGLIGVDMTNRANQAQASDNRNFQAEMSNTAHQREVADLKAAGLNPILSANAGASTPGGAQATMENALGAGLSSAMEARRLRQDLKKSEAEVGALESNAKKNNADTELSKALKSKADVESAVLSKGIPEAEVKNQLYEKIGKPLLNKVLEKTQSTPRADDNYMRDFNKRMQEKNQNSSIPLKGLR